LGSFGFGSSGRPNTRPFFSGRRGTAVENIIFRALLQLRYGRFPSGCCSEDIWRLGRSLGERNAQQVLANGSAILRCPEICCSPEALPMADKAINASAERNTIVRAVPTFGYGQATGGLLNFQLARCWVDSHQLRFTHAYCSYASNTVCQLRRR
jgi:hypothetical protein